MGRSTECPTITSERAARRAVDVARVTAGVAIALGITVLAGWWIGDSTLASGASWAPLASANSALKAILFGIALALDTWRSATRRWRLLGLACAAASLAVAAFTIVEHALGVSTPLDHALIGGAGAPLAPYHGKPSLHTAITFALLSSALLLGRRGGASARARDVLALAGGSGALIALFGYLFDIPALYGVELRVAVVGMAIPTAVAALSLAIGTLAARPDLGLVSIVTCEEAGGPAARRLLTVLVALGPLAIGLELLARFGWLPQSMADALVVFLGLTFGVAAILRTSSRLNVQSAELGAALGEANRWKRLFEHASWGAAVRSLDGKILAANAALHRLHGYPPGQLVGRAAAELFAPGARADLEARLQSMAPGEQLALESEQRRSDGATFPALIDAAAVTDDAGHLKYRAMFVRDVSELHRLEQDRRRLANLVESSDDAILGVTLDGIIFAWNRGAERVYGYPAEEIIGRSVMSIVPPERAGEAEQILERIRRGEHVPSHETTRLRRDGTIFPVSLTISPIVAESGEVIGVSGIARDISERRAMEEALRRSEAQYRMLMEQASDGVFVADLSSRILDVNSAATRMLGYAREELIGRVATDLLPPEDVERFWSVRERLLRGEVDVAEWALRRKDGSLAPVEASTKLLPDGRWQALVRDITERKWTQVALVDAHRTEQELRCELERVLAASGAISDALSSVPEGSSQLALEAVAKQAQLLTDAEGAAACIDCRDDQPRWRFVGMAPEQASAIVTWTLDGEVGRGADVDRHLPSGERPPSPSSFRSLLAVPIRSRGRPVGTLILTNKRSAGGFDEADERIVRALAARSGAAIELARLYEREGLERAWLETIVEQLPEAVVIADEQGRVVQQNEAAVRLATRTGRVDASGSPADHELRSASGAELEPDALPLARALAGEEVAAEELCLVKPDGELLPVLVGAKPIRTASGPAGAIMVFQDISARKDLERLREEWSSIVAHDLRQPVAAIAMAAELIRLRDGEQPDVEQRALARIRSASGRLERMIGDLLDVSRIDARRLSLERRTTDLSGLVEGAVEELREPLSGFRVSVEVEPLALTYADPDRIRQVLGNILTNATKYGERGTEIRIELRRDGDQLRVSVTNSGPGIEPHELPHLFDRFSRTPAARARAPGIGLGLYISKGLVESHGGRIWAESTPGETTTVHFSLPAMARAPLHASPA